MLDDNVPGDLDRRRVTQHAILEIRRGRSEAIFGHHGVDTGIRLEDRANRETGHDRIADLLNVENGVACGPGKNRGRSAGLREKGQILGQVNVDGLQDSVNENLRRVRVCSGSDENRIARRSAIDAGLDRRGVTRAIRPDIPCSTEDGV